MHKHFVRLKKYYKTHKAAAAEIGVSYSQYNLWRARPDLMPARAKTLIRLAAESTVQPDLTAHSDALDCFKALILAYGPGAVQKAINSLIIGRERTGTPEDVIS